VPSHDKSGFHEVEGRARSKTEYPVTLNSSGKQTRRANLAVECSSFAVLITAFPMSLDTPSPKQINGSGNAFAIVAARYNQELVDSLVREACATLEAAGAKPTLVERAPGSAELPFAASLLAQSGKFDAIITIGMVIAGSTQHHKIIGESTAIALQQVSIQTGLPVINGIIVAENQEQAAARAGTTINRGKEFAEAALEMAALSKKWTTKQNP